MRTTVSSLLGSPRTKWHRGGVVAVIAVLGLATLSACTPADGDSASQAPQADGTPAPTGSAAQLITNVRGGQVAKVDKTVTVSVQDGTLTKVTLATAKGEPVKGTFDNANTTWTSYEALDPSTAYKVAGQAVDADGVAATIQRKFRTEKLPLDRLTYPSITPGSGTVGIGMPVIVHFDVPVTDKASIEKHLSVEAKPAQVGSWHWISDNEVHWRPKTYWKPNTDVTVHADIKSVKAGNGIYGQVDKQASFHIGSAVVMKVNVADHHMRVFRNGKLINTIPITAGKPGFTTRSGIKVIIEKLRYHTMNAETIGMSTSDPEYYNMENVEYAQRVTYSGEFLHAAPWSVGSQGYDNVSHGCVGMSTANAGWLFGVTKVGDVVEVTGTDRPMEPTNGYGDWNLKWSTYKAGSALD